MHENGVLSNVPVHCAKDEQIVNKKSHCRRHLKTEYAEPMYETETTSNKCWHRDLCAQSNTSKTMIGSAAIRQQRRIIILIEIVHRRRRDSFCFSMTRYQIT